MSGFDGLSEQSKIEAMRHLHTSRCNDWPHWCINCGDQDCTPAGPERDANEARVRVDLKRRGKIQLEVTNAG